MPEKAKAKSPKSKSVRKPTTRKSRATKKEAEPRARTQETPAVVTPTRRTYIFAVGRRKTAVARVRLTEKGNGDITINGKPMPSYFPTTELQSTVRKPIDLTGHRAGGYSIKVRGGGVHSQAESVRHGIARVLLLANPDYRKTLKPAGLLTRDARVKERKKYGLKRARRAPQWQKR